jgi:ATP adenylyltransferase
MSSEPFVDLTKARYQDQHDVMQEIADEGHCPFCPEHLHKYHKQPILRQGEHWTVTPNQWPYENTRLHLLAITSYHTETLSDLRQGSMDELLGHLQWAELTYKIAAGGLAMRFGDLRKNGATVNHLHAHLIVPEDNLPPKTKVRFKIS